MSQTVPRVYIYL